MDGTDDSLDLGLSYDFWTAGYTVDLVTTGQLYLYAPIEYSLSEASVLSGLVDIGVDATARCLINWDPNGDGSGNGDFAIMVRVFASTLHCGPCCTVLTSFNSENSVSSELDTQ